MKKRFDVTVTIVVNAKNKEACRGVAEAAMRRLSVSAYGASSDHGGYDYRTESPRRLRIAKSRPSRAKEDENG